MRVLDVLMPQANEKNEWTIRYISQYLVAEKLGVEEETKESLIMWLTLCS